MAHLLRRADEERIGMAARARSGRREARLLQGLVSHDYGAVAAAAMALILARGRRRDRFGQCLIAFDDLSATTAPMSRPFRGCSRFAPPRFSRDAEPSGADLELAQAAEQSGRRAGRGARDRCTHGSARTFPRRGGWAHGRAGARGGATRARSAFVAEVIAARAGIPVGYGDGEELLSGEARGT